MTGLGQSRAFINRRLVMVLSYLFCHIFVNIITTISTAVFSFISSVALLLKIHKSVDLLQSLSISIHHNLKYFMLVKTFVLLHWSALYSYAALSTRFISSCSSSGDVVNSPANLCTLWGFSHHLLRYDDAEPRRRGSVLTAACCRLHRFRTSWTECSWNSCPACLATAGRARPCQNHSCSVRAIRNLRLEKSSGTLRNFIMDMELYGTLRILQTRSDTFGVTYFDRWRLDYLDFRFRNCPWILFMWTWLASLA